MTPTKTKEILNDSLSSIENSYDSCSDFTTAFKKRFPSQFRQFKVISVEGFLLGKQYHCYNEFDQSEYTIQIVEDLSMGLKLAQKCALLNQEYGYNHIVKYCNSWKENDKIFICFEKFEKIQIENESQIWKLISDIVQGLQKLHKNNVQHLNIELQNISFSNGRYKLNNLGVMSLLQDQGDFQKIKNLIKYSSPDQDFSQQDVYSLGMTVFHLMSQSPNNEQTEEIQYSTDLKKLVEEMTKNNTKDRITLEQLSKQLQVDQSEDLSQELMELQRQILDFEIKQLLQ